MENRGAEQGKCYRPRHQLEKAAFHTLKGSRYAVMMMAMA
jgi:hypothetical protein